MIKINADSAFYIGKTHTVCQDYARVTNGDKPLMILCDGCSDSPDTDIGARLMAMAVERTFRVNEDYPYGSFRSVAMTFASDMAFSLGIKHQSLDATLMVSSLVNTQVEVGTEGLMAWKDCIDTRVWGDGVIVVKQKDGVIRVHSIEYLERHPYYLTYFFDKKRGETWKKRAKVDTVQGERTNMVVTTYLLKPDWTVDKEYRSDFMPTTSNSIVEWGSEVITEKDKEQYAKVMPRSIPFHVGAFGSGATDIVENTEWVALLSDGVHSFWEKAMEPGAANRSIPLLEVLKGLLDFLSFQGEFVRRQANWFMKEAAKKNWHHNDDVSIAALHVG
jgi:hypothetical protein